MLTTPVPIPFHDCQYHRLAHRVRTKRRNIWTARESPLHQTTQCNAASATFCTTGNLNHLSRLASVSIIKQCHFGVTCSAQQCRPMRSIKVRVIKFSNYANGN